MIVRDAYGIVGQHRRGEPTYLEFGDSCSRTGILALEIIIDQDNHSVFCLSGKVVRHPFQPEWNDPNKTSRDNLVQYFVAPFKYEIASEYGKSWFINKDFLDPAVRLYLYKCSPQKAPLWLEILGTLWMNLSLLWNCLVKPNDEMNQFACMCIKYGPYYSRAFYNLHPKIEENIRAYWDNWRDQSLIGEVLIRALKRVGGI